jgi:hypothetical protein
MSEIIKEPFIVLAGGRIRCCRCQALSRRSKEQCKKPALRGKNVCDFHGGRSTGPKTEEGKARIANAHTIHGTETKAMREKRSRSSAYMRNLEDLLYVFGMTKAPRWRGRKPSGYWPIKTTEQAVDWIIQDILKTETVKP